MGNTGSALSDLHLFSKGGVFTSEQLDEYQVGFFGYRKKKLKMFAATIPRIDGILIRMLFS